MPNMWIRITLLAILVLLFQGTWALAGTTGGVSGYVLLQDNTPLAGAHVTATSPSQTTSTTSDTTGHYVFVSLTPDTYTIIAGKDGYDTVSQAGITVIADNVQTVTLRTQRSVKTLGVIPVRAANELVKPGTTADVYSVNAAQSSKLATLGGGGGADNAYGALASLPGAYVPPGQYGWYQTVHIRGGDYDQVGYEYDGVPVNRSFDNYPSSTASNVGQNEVQLYTGAAPQNAEGQGLSGFINQVIKNGTFPGFSTIDLAIGGPSLYNKVNLEIGGATPDRNFSYYVATGGYNARPRVIDNNNGASVSGLFGSPFDVTPCPDRGGAIVGTGGEYNVAINGNPLNPPKPADNPANASNIDCYQIFQSWNNVALNGPGITPVGPGGYLLGGIQNNGLNFFEVADRENVVNLHFGLPHRKDSGKDDIQFLFSNSLLRAPYYASAQDWGLGLFQADAKAWAPFSTCFGPNAAGLGNPGPGCGILNDSQITDMFLNWWTPQFIGATTPPNLTPFVGYMAGFQVGTPAGTVFTSGCAAPCGVIRYDYPSSNAAFNTCGGGNPSVSFVFDSGSTGCRYAIPPAVASGVRDSSENGQGIYKLQYQHNIGSNAYFRVYGYSYYSWWFLWGANTFNNGFVGCCPGDYELTTHTRGASAQFADQIDSHNLITAQIAGVTASTVRDNNTQILTFATGARRRAFVNVSAANPYNGLCYTSSGKYGSCQPDSVNTPGRASYEAYYQAMFGGLPAPANNCGNTSGVNGAVTGACAWLEAESGPYATYNTVKPLFYSASLGDQYKPSDKWLFNLGLRFDSFGFTGRNYDNGNITTFWFNAWNNGQCISALPGSSAVDKMEDLNTYPNGINGYNMHGLVTPLTDCTTIPDPTNPGHTYLNATLANQPGQKFTYTTFEPRIGGTYAAGSDDVIRFSAGEYVQAPNAAFEQYATLQQNIPEFLGRRFLPYGFTTAGHNVVPERSYNYDVSLEHRFANSDYSFKLTPFLRQTHDQYQQFFLDQKTGFVSGLPVGKQTAEGVEFELQKGDFNRNGLSGLLTYTYTWSYIKYQQLPGNGGTVVTAINNAIKTYNAYTSSCAANPSDARCGSTSDFQTSAPCYGGFGTPAPGCPAGSIANPYWNAPVQPLFDPNASYIPYSILPNGFNSSTNSYSVPHVGTLVLNWRHDKLSITPSVQYFGEGFYGAPLQNPGVDLATNLIPGNSFFIGNGVAGGCYSALSSSVTGDPRYPYGAPAGSPYDALTCASNILIPDPYTGRFDGLGDFRTPQQLVGHLQISYEATPRVTYVANFDNLVDTCWGGSTMPWTKQPGVDHRVCSYGLPGYAPIPAMGNFYNPDTIPQAIVKYPYMPIYGVSPIGGTFEVKVKL